MSRLDRSPCGPVLERRHRGASAVTREGFDGGGGCGRGTLLLVEDDRALRQMLAWELSELGYGVHPVGSCREARAVVRSRRLDAALLDVGLPDGNGIDLAADLLSIHPGTKIILCSGRHNPIAPRERSPGVIAFLVKPVSVHAIDSLFRGGSQ